MVARICNEGSDTKLVFVNLNYDVASEGRESELCLNGFAEAQLSWSGPCLLLASTMEGNLAIIDYQGKTIRRQRLDGILAASWLPAEEGGLPGCRAFFVLQPNGLLWMYRQFQTNGPFVSDSVQLSRWPATPTLAQFIFRERCYLALTLNVGLALIELVYNVTKCVMEERPVGVYSWEQQPIIPIKVIWRGERKVTIFGFTTVADAKVVAKKISLDDSGGNTDVVFSKENIRAILSDDDAEDSIILVGDPSFARASIDDGTIEYEAIATPKILSFGNVGTSECIAWCLSANGTVVFGLDANGTLFNLVQRMNESLNDKFEHAWNEMGSLWDFAESRPSVKPSTALSKSHTMTLLMKDNLRAENYDRYWLFHSLWRLFHFWEVAIACSTDLPSSISDTTRFEVRPDLLPSLLDPSIDAIDNLRFLMGKDQLRPLFGKVLNVKELVERLLATLYIIQSIRATLVGWIGKYTVSGVTVLLTYSRLLLSKMDLALVGLELDSIISTLEECKMIAKEDVLLNIFNEESPTVDLPICTVRLEFNALDRDVTTGGPLGRKLLEACPACNGMRNDPFSGIDLPTIPFWYSYWHYICPCGSPYR